MVLFPHAKINLGLQVIEKRQDGFHNIVSCFYPIGWCDVLEIIEKPELSFRATGLNIPGNSTDNLCLKAYHLMRERFDIPPVYIHLHKVIPIGSGLGGGSANAAFLLKGLNQLFDLSLSNHQLKALAAALGSDCAFFIEGKPMLATGKGELLEEIEISVPGKYLVVVTPPLQVNTGEAYSMLTPREPVVDLREALNSKSGQWTALIANDFEGPVFEKYPEIGHVKETLIARGAVYASLSGSGSSVYGFFEEEQDFESWFGTDHLVWVQEIKALISI